MTPLYEILITGSAGMLGRYIKESYENTPHCYVVTLGRSKANHIVCDLEKDVPDFRNNLYHIVIHAAQTDDESRALSLNYEGTQRLLEGLRNTEVRKFVYISSVDVYGKTEGLDIDEDTPLRPLGKVGQSMVLAEREVRKFCDERGIVLTILRPATMFGKGMHGWGARMAAQVLSGFYFNIRESDARVSLVTAYDVARVIHEVSIRGGIYNVTDGRDHTLADLATAMGNNRGQAKRPLWIPLKWAKLLAKFGDKMSLPGRLLNSRELQRRTSAITYSNRRINELLQNESLEFKFFDTVAVTGRTDKDYPYEDD